MKKINLGDHVRDVYTGFQGTAIARTEWLHGCSRILIEPRELDKDGKLREGQTFDEQRVELVKAEKPIDTSEGKLPPGGPFPDPQRPADPTR